MNGTDEWPPKKARSREDWVAYWERQRWDRRLRRKIGIRSHRYRRRLGAPRRAWRWLRAFIRRGQHGWAPRDTWSLDDYLCQLIGDAVACLRDNSHGYPCSCEHAPGEDGIYRPSETCTCPEDYTAVLTSIAEPLQAYHDHWSYADGQTAEEHREAEVKIIAGAQDALRLLAEHLPSLWD